MFERIEVASPEVVSLGRRNQVDSPNDKQHSTTRLIGIVFWLRFCCWRKVERSLGDLDNNFGRNDVLLFEHSGSKDRDSADESVCNKSCVDPIAHACLYSSTFFLLAASGTWEIEPLGEKLSAQQCSRWKTVYYVPWGGGGVQFSKRPRFGGQFWKSTKCDRGRNSKTRDWHSM